MINKKSLWFLTLFSLILVLSVYYITMPSELLLTQDNSLTANKEAKKSKDKNNTDNTNSKKTSVEVKDDTLKAMRVESDSQMNEELEELQVVLNDESSSAEEKNEAYEKMKKLNNNRAEEETLEEKIKSDFNLNAYIKIENNSIKVIIKSAEHDTSLANKIMRNIQNNYEENKYVTVKFQE